jgi:hypothetical protein
MKRKKRRMVNAAEVGIIRRSIEHGDKPTEIARRLGRTYKTIYNIVKREGYTIQKKETPSQVLAKANLALQAIDETAVKKARSQSIEGSVRELIKVLSQQEDRIENITINVRTGKCLLDFHRIVEMVVQP